MTRRTAMATLAGAAAAIAAPSRALRLEIGNYGMQTLEVDRAIALIREIGYDGAELCLMRDWQSEPRRLDGAARRRIRETGFPIPSLIESFNLMAPTAELNSVPDRIRASAELAHDLAPKNPPLLQTVLGGKAGDWENVREVMVTRLRGWAAEAGGRWLT